MTKILAMIEDLLYGQFSYRRAKNIDFLYNQEKLRVEKEEQRIQERNRLQAEEYFKSQN